MTRNNGQRKNTRYLHWRSFVDGVNQSGPDDGIDPIAITDWYINVCRHPGERGILHQPTKKEVLPDCGLMHTRKSGVVNAIL